MAVVCDAITLVFTTTYQHNKTFGMAYAIVSYPHGAERNERKAVSMRRQYMVTVQHKVTKQVLEHSVWAIDYEEMLLSIDREYSVIDWKRVF